MAASQNDKARKSYSYLQKTLNANISAVDVALTPNNVTSIPTDTGVSFVIDRVDSAGNKTPALRELMTGYVSGSTIAGLQRGEQGTTAQVHLANAVIEFVNSGEMWNDLIDFLLQDHENPNGNHKTLTDTNGNEWLERGVTASAVNQLKATNAATGNAPALAASGDDTNIDLKLDPKGTGVVKVDGSAPRQHIAQGNNYVESGCVWTGNSYGATLVASMSAGVVVINGKRLTVAAVVSRTFAASVDTYVDLQDNNDGTAIPTYTTAVNNAASPAIPNGKTTSTNLRNGIVVSGATNIAAATSINQGSILASLPTSGTVPLAVCDTLGNLIYPRANQRLIGARVYPAGAGPSSASTSLIAAAAGLNIPVLAANLPNGSSNIKATLASRSGGGVVGGWEVGICLGSALAANLLPGADFAPAVTNIPVNIVGSIVLSANNTLVPSFSTTSGTVSLQAFNSSLIHLVEID